MAVSNPLHTPTLRTSLRLLTALFALSAAACDDIDDLTPESEDLAPPEHVAADDQDDDAAEAPPHAGPDDLQAPIEPKAAHSMCCELDFASPFTINVRIPNPGPTVLTECSDLLAGSKQINYKVYHYYGSPAPFTGTTSGIPLGTTRVIPLSHSGYLNAMSCEAWYN